MPRANIRFRMAIPFARMLETGSSGVNPGTQPICKPTQGIDERLRHAALIAFATRCEQV